MPIDTRPDSPSAESAPDIPPTLAPPRQVVPPVSARAHATIDPVLMRVSEDAAVKQNAFPSRSGDPSGMAHWETHLHLVTWVRNTTFAKHVWVDVHVFGHDGRLVDSATLPLAYSRPAGDGGDLFAIDQLIYEGTTATQGSVSLRPDARVVQYRVYCELDGRVVTDGVLHECVLRSDVSSV